MTTDGKDIDIGASAVNRGRRLFWCERYGVAPIEQMIDAFGDDTEETDDAVIAIVKINPACWLNIDLRTYSQDRLPN